MQCPRCHRPVHLLSRRHPQRLLLPRCRACHAYVLSPAHKAVLYLLGAAALYLLIQTFFK